MEKLSINELELKGKRVLIRADFNVPLDEQGNITDDTRIRAALPTINYALDGGARVIIASHLGRPKGKVDPRLSLLPVAKRLGRLLGKEVTLAEDCIGERVKEAVSRMKPGDVLLLENLRFHPGEEANDEGFAAALAELADSYVDDAFGNAHRPHASMVGVTKFLPSAMGFLMKKELDYFKRAMEAPRRPLVAILGGAKVREKIKVLEHLIQRVDKVLIGGGMAFTFLKALGYSVGRSLLEEAMTSFAMKIIETASVKGIKFYLPVDCVVADKLDPRAESKVVPVQEIPNDWTGLDIGPATATLFKEALQNAKTIVWNGPMGVFEMDAFSQGTFAIAHAVADSFALTIVGGGDTDVAVQRARETERISYISTGGGAFIELLEGKELPAVAALSDKR